MKEWMKDNVVSMLVIGLLVFFAGIAIYKNWTKSNQSQPTQIGHTSVTKPDSSKVRPETTDEKNYRRAKLMLEHPYSKSSTSKEKQARKAFTEAIQAIQQAGHVSKIKGRVENHLSMTQSGMIQTLAMVLLVNNYTFQSSELEVTLSDNEDVVQFLMVLTKKGEDNCYFVGNFNTTVNQIQLKSYVGGNIGGTYG